MHGEHDVGARAVGAQPGIALRPSRSGTQVGVLQLERVAIDRQLRDEERRAGLKAEAREEVGLRNSGVPAIAAEPTTVRTCSTTAIRTTTGMGPLARRAFRRAHHRGGFDETEAAPPVELLDGGDVGVERCGRERLSGAGPQPLGELGGGKRCTPVMSTAATRYGGRA